jgi:hypothetical protein
VSIDEWRRSYVEYLVTRPHSEHLFASAQDLKEVWFAGVHSDVGGMFLEGARLSDIPLKWMAEEAVHASLLVRPKAYAAAEQVTDGDATGATHEMNKLWALLGTRSRKVPPGALVHASVARRIATDPSYASRIPSDAVYVDDDWMVPRTLA